MVTYSRPPSAKPPSPLKNSSSGRGAAGSLVGLRSSRAALRGRAILLGTLQADDLVGEAAPAAQQDGPGRGLEERAVLGGEPVAAQDVHPAAARMALVGQGGLARPHQGLERVVEVLGVGGAVLVEDHEVDVEELQPPVLVRTEQLPDDVEVLGLVDPHHDDGQVARDAVGPEAGRSPLVAGQQAGRRPQRRVRVEDPVGQALEEVGLVGLDPEVVELDLGLRPGEGRRPLEGGRLAVLVGQVQDLLARLGDDRREDRVGGRPRGEPDPAAEAEDRVQHRADRVRERTPVDDRDRRADRPTPAEEAGPIGLVLDDPAGLLLDRRDVRGPDRRLVAGSWTAGRQEGADLGDELGLHEQVLEGRVSDIGRLRREDDLRV